jgi:hypothetical protein
MSTTATAHPPLSEHQVRTLALLLQRAIANQQLALHEQLLDAAGVETEEGANIVATDWVVQADEIVFDDETPACFGIHLYVAATDLDELCGGES